MRYVQWPVNLLLAIMFMVLGSQFVDTLLSGGWAHFLLRASVFLALCWFWIRTSVSYLRRQTHAKNSKAPERLMMA